MTLVEKNNLKRILKEFNENELGGGYLYFLHLQNKEEMLIQMDLVDYSTVIVCPISQILNVEFIEQDEDGIDVQGIYIELEEVYEGINSCWIDEMGCCF